MAKFWLITGYLSEDDDNYPDESEHTKSLEIDLVVIENSRDNYNNGIKSVEHVMQVHEITCKAL